MISDGIRAMFNLSSCSVKKFKHETEHWFTFQPTWGMSPDFLCRRKIRLPVLRSSAFYVRRHEEEQILFRCQTDWPPSCDVYPPSSRDSETTRLLFYNNALHYNYRGGGDPGNVSVCTCTAVVLSSFWQEGSECSGVFWFCSFYHEYFES